MFFRWGDNRGVWKCVFIVCVVSTRIGWNGVKRLTLTFEYWRKLLAIAVNLARTARRHLKDVNMQTANIVPAQQTMVVINLGTVRRKIVRQICARLIWCAVRSNERRKMLKRYPFRLFDFHIANCNVRAFFQAKCLGVLSSIHNVLPFSGRWFCLLWSRISNDAWAHSACWRRISFVFTPLLRFHLFQMAFPFVWIVGQ